MRLMAGDFFELLDDIVELRGPPKPESNNPVYLEGRNDVRERTDNFIVSFIGVLEEKLEEMNAKLVNNHQSAYVDTKPENVFLFNADVKYWLGLDPSRWDEELRSQIVVGDIGHGRVRRGSKVAYAELTHEYCPSRLFSPETFKVDTTLEDTRVVFANVALHVLDCFLPRVCRRQYEELIDIKENWFTQKGDDSVAVVRKIEASVLKCYVQYFKRTPTSKLDEILRRVVLIKNKEFEARSLF